MYFTEVVLFISDYNAEYFLSMTGGHSGAL
jgi:hypothetical protein